MIYHSTAAGGAAAQAFGGRKELQPARRCNVVHDAHGCGLKTLLHCYTGVDDVRVATELPTAIVRKPKNLSVRSPTRSSSAPASAATPPFGR